MRGFKIISIFCLCVYVISLVFVNITSNEKFNYLYFSKENVFEELNRSNKKIPRIVIFGSSHCDVGLKAKDIAEKIGIPTYNFCHFGWNSDKRYLNKLLAHLNTNDYLIYVQRIDFSERGSFKKTDNLFIRKLKLFPEISMYLRLKNEKFTKDGDRILFNVGKANKYPDYKVNYSFINENLEFQLKAIEKLTIQNSLNPPKIIVITAPILIKNIDLLDTQKIQIIIDEHPSLLAWIPPIITNEQKYFGYDLFHLNEAGREVWTLQLINDLKKIIK
jgi:hypothetical protein